jgi:hypothetical protein
LRLRQATQTGLVLAVLIAACGDRTALPSEPVTEAPTVPAAELREVVPPEPAAVDSLRPFRWYVQVPERDTAPLGDGALHGHSAQPIVGAPRRYTVTREGGDIVLVREDRAEGDPPRPPTWTKRIPLGATGDPVVGSTMGSALYIAAPTVDGYAIAAVSAEDGSTTFQARHVADPESAVQLDFVPEEVTVYLRSPTGDALDVLDANSGAVRERARFGTEVRHASADPPPNAVRGTPRGRSGGPDAAYRVMREGSDGMAIARTGAIEWRTPLVPKQIFDDHLTLVEAGGRIVAVSFCGNASGTFAFGFDPATGAIVWTSSVGSIGTIGHSRYRNDVRAVVDGERVVVYGAESSGKYVGVLDPREGRLIGWEVWRP